MNEYNYPVETGSDPIEFKLDKCIKAIPDFPIDGVVFRDLSPVWRNAALCREAIQEFASRVEKESCKVPDAVIGIESRGFILGMPLSLHWDVPFTPFRKPGKLPGRIYSEQYELEYGMAELQCQIDCLKPGMEVVIHDDVLATGGTALSAQKLVEKTGAKVMAYAFMIELSPLRGSERLNAPIHSLITY